MNTGVTIKFRGAPKYRFAPDILKIEDENGKPEQHIIIVLKRDDCGYYVISPATSLTRCWNGLKDKTKIEYFRRLCEFLNYAYFEKRIAKFQDIENQLVIDFLNRLSQDHTRSYVKLSVKVLKQVFYYAAVNYERICDIDQNDIIIQGKKNKSVLIWSEVEHKVILPSVNSNLRKQNKLTNIDDTTVFRLIDIAIYEAPNCAFGFYLMFFGGLRSSEVCHLSDADIPAHIEEKGIFNINLRDEILNVDSKYSDISQNKRNRKQSVLIIPGLFDAVKTLYLKHRNGHNPVIMNKQGKAMTDRGFRDRFNSIKAILIGQLKDSDNPTDQITAFQLSHMIWSTHIGRGYYSNLIARFAKNPYNIAVARGDSGFDSVLPYLAESEAVSNGIIDILEKMYKEGRNNDQVTKLQGN